MTETALFRRQQPWQVSTGLASVLTGWQNAPRVWRNIVMDHTLAPLLPREVPLPEDLHPKLVRAFERKDLRALYSHQARAFELAKSGKDVVIATPTASGKSLAYNLPVLDALARDSSCRALYLFPTKALARDQEEALRRQMTDAELSLGAVTFDGDTPADARKAAREKSHVLITNPDMLHTGILPHHASWARLFANLRYVVIDELHMYRGVFGSHLANVLRRLDRVARFHGAQPVYVFASATIGNPQEHAERMIGRPVECVSQSGAPQGSRRVLVYNPPVVNPELGIRESCIKTAARLTADLVRAQVPTLLFGQSRNAVEMMLKYLRDALAKDPVDPSSLHAYRGGYLPQTRRNIEAGLRNGDIRCVVSTNALELGVDIGSLDAVVCAGYPGSVAGLWQRFGRAGRRQGESLGLMVSSSAPLDQYIAADPSYLIRSPVEHARIDPDNAEILVQHLKCASFELPFEQGDGFRDVAPDGTADALEFLVHHGVLHPSESGGRKVFHWSADQYPANHVSLRSIGWDNFVIIDLGTQKTLAEMDFRSTHTMLHEQAIYQHEGEQYQVERLDYDNHKAYVRKVEPDYFTDAMTYTRIEVMKEDSTASLASEGCGLTAGFGEVSVTEKVVGYKKIKFHTHENVGYGEVTLPEMQMHTTALWLTVPEELIRAQPHPRPVFLDGLRAVGHALHTVACIGLMIDPRDLGRTLGTQTESGQAKSGNGRSQEQGFEPTLFLYDHFPGGVGLSSRLYEDRWALLRRARTLIDHCACGEGCPACVGPLSPDSALATLGARGGLKTLAQDVMSAVGVTAAV